MGLATPTTAILLLGVIILATLLITHKTSADTYDKSKAFVFVTVLAGLGIIITFFFYYGVLELNQRQQRLIMVQETARISDMLVEELMSEIVTAGKVVPNFAASVTPLQQRFAFTSDPSTQDAVLTKLFLSYKIFSIWQDVLMADEFTGHEPLAYISNFLQRANSSQLYDQWTRVKIDFNEPTQEFGDLLFEYALPIKDQRPEVYVETARRLLADPRLSRIQSIFSQ